MRSLGKWLCVIALCSTVVHAKRLGESSHLTSRNLVTTLSRELKSMKAETEVKVTLSLKLGRLLCELGTKAAKNEAREIYRHLLAKHPKDPRRDEMLFYLGTVSDSNDSFKKLVEKFPQSPFVPEARCRLADRALKADRDDEATALYERAFATGKPDVRERALRGLARIAAGFEDIGDSLTRFAKLSPIAQRAALETVASVMADDERLDDTILVNEKLLAIDPGYQYNPRYEMAIVGALEASQRRVEAARRVFDRLTYYVKGSRWFSANETMPRVTREALVSFEENGRRLVLALDARKSYELYLNAFPTTPYSADVRSHYAALLFRLEARTASAEQFYTAYRDLAGRPNAEEALRNSLAALEAALNRARSEKGLGPVSRDSRELLKDDGDVIALDELEARFVEVGGEYLKSYPRAAEIADVLYERAYLFYLHRDFARAFPPLQEIWQRHNTSYALFGAAANVSTDILNRQHDWAGLSILCRELMKRSAVGSELREELATSLRRSEMNRIAGIERAGNLREAARQYVDYIAELGTQDPSNDEVALYSASLDFTRAGAYADAVKLQEKFLRLFPGSPRVPEVLLSLGKNDEWLADLAGAATALERFARIAPEHRQARHALRWAATYWGGVGNRARAIAAMERYAGGEAGAEAELLEFYETHGAIDRAIALHRRERARKGIGPVESAERAVRLAELAWKSDRKLPAPLLLEALTLAKKGNAPAALVAKLGFWSASGEEVAFYAKPSARTLEKVVAAYEPVVAAGGEWALGALYRLGKAHARMARELGESAAQFSANYDDKARTFAAKCLERTAEAHLLSIWTARCYRMASELDPRHYPGAHTLYLPPVTTEVIEPARRENVSPAIGKVARSVYPYFSSLLFRAGVSMPPGEPLAGEEDAREISAETMPSAIPEPMTYRLLGETRKAWIARSLAVAHDGVQPTFAYLNLLRMSEPARALPLIREAIRRAPEEAALHNLLALTYLERDDLPAAKATWLSLVARGGDMPAVWNNLGVIAYLEGREGAAVEIFKRAGSWTNLGFLALKYHASAAALELFDKAGGDGVAVQVGRVEARVQAGEGIALKETIESLVMHYEDDPYARIVGAHYLLDVEKHAEGAKKFLRDYLDAQPGAVDGAFNRAVREAAGPRKVFSSAR